MKEIVSIFHGLLLVATIQPGVVFPITFPFAQQSHDAHDNNRTYARFPSGSVPLAYFPFFYFSFLLDPQLFAGVLSVCEGEYIHLFVCWPLQPHHSCLADGEFYTR